MKSRLCEGVAVRVCWWWSCAWKVVVECRRKMEVPFFASKLGYLWGLFVDVVHRVLKYCLCWSFVYIIMADSFVHLCWGFGVHEVICGIYFMHNYFFENWVGPKMKEKKYICEKVVLTAIFILFFIFSFFLFFIIKKMGNKHLNTKNSTKGSATSYNESNRRPKERGQWRNHPGNQFNRDQGGPSTRP